MNFTKTNSFLNSPFARPHHFLPFLSLPNLPSASIAVLQGQLSNQNAPACMPNRERRPFSLFVTDRLVSTTFAFPTGLKNAPRLSSRHKNAMTCHCEIPLWLMHSHHSVLKSGKTPQECLQKPQELPLQCQHLIIRFSDCKKGMVRSCNRSLHLYIISFPKEIIPLTIYTCIYSLTCGVDLEVTTFQKKRKNERGELEQ